MRTVAGLLTLATAVALSAGGCSKGPPAKMEAPAKSPRPPSANPVIPVNQAARFAWQLFVEVNPKAKNQTKIKVGKQEVFSNDARWEQWANDQLTFPANPDPAHPPSWPKAGTSRLQLRPE